MRTRTVPAWLYSRTDSAKSAMPNDHVLVGHVLPFVVLALVGSAIGVWTFRLRRA
jgi:hypothetical protein